MSKKFIDAFEESLRQQEVIVSEEVWEAIIQALRDAQESLNE